MKRVQAFIAGLAFAGLFLGATSATADEVVIDRIVAQINEEIITEYELEQAALSFLIQQGVHPQVLDNPRQRRQVMEETLEDLINRILVEQEAARLGIEIAQEEIDLWIADTRSQQGLSEEQFRQMIGQYGISFEDYEQIIADNLLQMRLMQMRSRGAAVSESEVEAMYRRRYGAQTTEVFREIRHILIVPDPETGGVEGAMEIATDLREQILAGEDFGALADQYSQGPGAGAGGMLGRFRRGQLESSFEDIAFAIAVGELSEPVETSFGIHLIEVLSEEESAGGENVERRKAEIRAWLQQQAMERQLTTLLSTLRTRAFVDVRY